MRDHVLSLFEHRAEAEVPRCMTDHPDALPSGSGIEPGVRRARQRPVQLDEIVAGALLSDHGAIHFLWGSDERLVYERAGGIDPGTGNASRRHCVPQCEYLRDPPGD